MGKFVSTVFADLEDTGRASFRSAGNVPFAHPRSLHRRHAIAVRVWRSSHGALLLPHRREGLLASRSTRNWTQRFGAPGDFAQAYVLAHEVGHHVKNLLGIMERIQRMRRALRGGHAGLVRAPGDFRPIAWPECGRPRVDSGIYWSPAMWRRDCARPLHWRRRDSATDHRPRRSGNMDPMDRPSRG